MPEYAAKKYQVSSRVNSSELSTTGNQVVTKKSLESVVRSATEDEDRSQNLSIFGLTEQDSEKRDRKVYVFWLEWETSSVYQQDWSQKKRQD